MAIAILLVRGITGTRPDTKHTLKLLKLTRVNHCVIYPDAEKIAGMLKMVKDYVTWGEVSKETLKDLVECRGRLPGDKPIPKDMITAVIAALEKGERTNMKPVFRLHPPRKGFKDKKEVYPRGDLGYRGDEIKKLLDRMM
jgi:large subunit ribosomal protein L30